MINKIRSLIICILFLGIIKSDISLHLKKFSRRSLTSGDYVGFAAFYGGGISASVLIDELEDGTTHFDWIINTFVNSSSAEEYPWHIHQYKVKSYKDCDNAGPHYDPTGINPGDKNPNYKCNPKTPSKCQVGDLSGKHFNLVGQNNYHFELTDSQVKIKGNHSVINRSVVIHYPKDKRRLICGTIEKVLIKDLISSNNKKAIKSNSDTNATDKDESKTQTSEAPYTSITATVTSSGLKLYPNIILQALLLMITLFLKK